MKPQRFRQGSRDGLETETTVAPSGTLYHRLATGGEKVAFIEGKEMWTYERLATEVERLARGLVKRGLRKGDRVVMHMANLPELVIAYQACFRVGVIAAPLNIRFKMAELTALLQRLRPALYIGQAALYSRVASIDSSILALDRRFIVDGSVEDPRVQPWILPKFSPLLPSGLLTTKFRRPSRSSIKFPVTPSVRSIVNC